jgi:hypothetical protein
MVVMIKKVKGGYKAATEKGRPLSKKAKTRKAAAKQLYAVHKSKEERNA